VSITPPSLEGSFSWKVKLGRCCLLVAILLCSLWVQLHHNLSIFTAEMLAIYFGLIYIQNNLHPHTKKIVICTDSQSALQKLKKPGNNFDLVTFWIRNLLTEKKAAGQIVYLMWIKGHSGFTGNEMADLYAKVT
jgi:ribonuclease HI